MRDGKHNAAPPMEPELFGTVFLPAYRGWRSLIMSAALHCALIPATPWLGMLLPDSDDSTRSRYSVTIRPLQIQVSDLLYLPAPSPRREKTAKPRPRSSPAPAKRPEARTEASKTPPRRFELPPLPGKVVGEQTVLQPQFPPDLPLQEQVRLPNVVFWSTARLPKPQPKNFVRPGSPKPMAPKTPALEAAPTLALPNREPLVSDLAVTGGVVLANPALPRPPSTTIPVRVFQPPSSKASGGLALDAIEGEPTNLIALSSSPAPLGRSIIVPAGNQLGQLPGPPEDAGGVGTGDDSGTGGGTGSGTGSSGAGTGGSGSGTGGSGSVSGASGSGSGGSGSGSGLGLGTGAGAGVGIGAGPEGGQILAMSNPPPGLAAVPARVVHPNTAVFDIVVHSASAGALPDTTGILSGKPVYTVYVRVGYERDWILQYCRPASAERHFRTRGNVVSLGNPAPVKAPYPLVTVMPPVAQEPRREPILVHGFLDTAGKLKALKIIREQTDQLRKQILPSLEQWEFRPGTRDGMPVLLEILLVIPANRA